MVRLGVFSVLPGLWLENALPVGFVKGLSLHVGGDLRVGGAYLANGFPGLPEQFPGLSAGVGAVVAGAAVRVVEEVLPIGVDDGEVAVIVKHLKNHNGVASPCRTTCTVCGDAPFIYSTISIESSGILPLLHAAFSHGMMRRMEASIMPPKGRLGLAICAMGTAR